MPEALAVRRKHGAEHEEKRSLLGPAENERRHTRDQARLYREVLRTKIVEIKLTIADAAVLFRDAVHANEEHIRSGNAIRELIVNVLLSELTGGVAGGLATGVKSIDKVLKQVLKDAAKSVPGSEPSTAHDLVLEIASRLRLAADRFSNEAQSAIDTVSDEEAAAEQQLLDALQSSPAVRDEAILDGDERGFVVRAVQNQFLEAAGMPVTGMQRSTEIATVLLQTYKAERTSRATTIDERNTFITATFSGRSPLEVENVVGDRADALRQDRCERKRASQLTNPATAVRGASEGSLR